MSELDETTKQTAGSLGCSLAMTSVFGVGLVGNFVKNGLSTGWLVVLSLILFVAVGSLSYALQKLFESGGGGGGGGGGRSAPDPKPKPKRKLKIPESSKVDGIPTHWPPGPSL